MAQSSVLVFGSLNIDDVYTVPDIVISGETISSLEYKQVAGGKGANQSIACSKCTRTSKSVHVYHAGKVGHDGLWLVDLLEKLSGAFDLGFLELRQLHR